jgi:hypothetical protein
MRSSRYGAYKDVRKPKRIIENPKLSPQRARRFTKGNAAGFFDRTGLSYREAAWNSHFTTKANCGTIVKATGRPINDLRSAARDNRSATLRGLAFMCRNIKTLFNFDPPVTDEEVRAASLQFVRKITGFNKPSKANEEAFLAAVEDVAAICGRLLRSLETNATPKNREEEGAKAKARAAERFAN